ncbi:MAG TPA: response regulator transcription factor [Chthoniobacteraceae bacterium]|jgi:DNA-binding response OmpR family regulator
MSRILVIEEELQTRQALFDLLQAQGHRVILESDGGSGLGRVLNEEIDLLLLDVTTSKIDGFALCAEIRRRLPELPILALTGKGKSEKRAREVDGVADEYLAKPFSERELLWRVRAILRRIERGDASLSRLGFGDVTIDFSKRTCTRAGNKVTLTAKEFSVLELLAEHAGEPVSRDDFLEIVWASDASPTTRTVDNQVLGLRAKLEADPDHPRHILTVHGIGYRLAMADL